MSSFLDSMFQAPDFDCPACGARIARTTEMLARHTVFHEALEKLYRTLFAPDASDEEWGKMKAHSAALTEAAVTLKAEEFQIQIEASMSDEERRAVETMQRLLRGSKQEGDCP